MAKSVNAKQKNDTRRMLDVLVDVELTGICQVTSCLLPLLTSALVQPLFTRLAVNERAHVLADASLCMSTSALFLSKTSRGGVGLIAS
jgi:hypothetical protein